MSTPLQNGLGHIYGAGKTLQTKGTFPVWLEQDASRVIGGLISLQEALDGTHKVVDFWPAAILTATPCIELGNHNYAPIPTYRLLNDVSAADTKLTICKREGLALLVNGMSLALASDASKNITIDTTSSGNTVINTDGNYEITITANDFGVCKAGDVFVLEAYAAKAPVGLTKSNLQYEGADVNSKLNITLIDRGRVMADTAAPASAFIREKLQTVKWEDIY